ncbi:MAG: hypothetical protein M3R38_16400 [Actinomycetota bacterium]|nr:hypothetical protein [Actinomycetota bacterium]
MFIELQRAWVPENVREDECGVCGHEVAPTSVIALAASDDRDDLGVACPSCVAYLGSRSPERSPTIEFYREMLEKYPAPMYASEEELERAAEDFEDPSDVAYEASWLWTVPREIFPTRP